MRGREEGTEKCRNEGGRMNRRTDGRMNEWMKIMEGGCDKGREGGMKGWRKEGTKEGGREEGRERERWMEGGRKEWRDGRKGGRVEWRTGGRKLKGRRIEEREGWKREADLCTMAKFPPFSLLVLTYPMVKCVLCVIIIVFLSSGVTWSLQESSMSKENYKSAYEIKKLAISMICFTHGTVYLEELISIKRQILLNACKWKWINQKKKNVHLAPVLPYWCMFSLTAG